MRLFSRLLFVFAMFLVSSLGSVQGGFPDGAAISLLQWKHFVPSYDE